MRYEGSVEERSHSELVEQLQTMELVMPRRIPFMMSIVALTTSATFQASAQPAASQGARDREGLTSGATAADVTGGAISAESYVTNAALSDLYEIQSSQLAQQKSRSAAIQKFAAGMIADHTATTSQLKAALVEANVAVTPPVQLDSRRQAMIDELTRATGPAFDRAYLDQQTLAHQEAIRLHSGYATTGKNRALQNLAATTAPKIQHHLEMVKQLDKDGADERH